MSNICFVFSFALSLYHKIKTHTVMEKTVSLHYQSEGFNKAILVFDNSKTTLKKVIREESQKALDLFYKDINYKIISERKNWWEIVYTIEFEIEESEIVYTCFDYLQAKRFAKNYAKNNNLKYIG